MAKKFKILKISKVVGSGSLAVGPSMSSKEADEFAKVNAEMVEVADTDKAGPSRRPERSRCFIIRRCADYTRNDGSAPRN